MNIYHIRWIIIVVLVGWLTPTALAGPNFEGVIGDFTIGFNVNQELVKAGDTIKVTGFGAAPDEIVSVLIVPDPDSGANALTVVEVMSDNQGDFRAFLKLPHTITPGRYAVRAEQPPGNGTLVNQYYWVGICVNECIGPLLSSRIDPQFTTTNNGLDSGRSDARVLKAWDNVSVGGYTSKVSVAQGESLDFHISTDQSQYNITIWREGSPRARMTTIRNLSGTEYNCNNGYQPPGCEWPVAYTLNVPTNWPSGAYTVEIPTNQKGTQYMIFWVRENNPGSTSSILLLSDVNTYNAYANFGGKSVYDGASSNQQKATKVSFNRPMVRDNGDGEGLGDFRKFAEDELITWLEDEGYPLEYATNYDLEFMPNLLNNYEVVIIVGHSEYWTWDARQQLKNFINGGGRFLNLSGNTMWWQVRYEDNGRTLVVYKDANLDPKTAPEKVTTNPGKHPIFDIPSPIIGSYWPYGGFYGVSSSIFQYEDGYGGYWVQQAGHWIFNGTGLATGDMFGRGSSKKDSILYYEADGTFFNCGTDGKTILGPLANSGTPKNFTILGSAPVYQAAIRFGVMGVYTTQPNPGGKRGAVFSVNATGWAGVIMSDAQVAQITRNVLNRFLANNIPVEPAGPDTDFLFYDRFNCDSLYHDGVRASYNGPKWYQGVDVGHQNYVKSNFNSGQVRLTKACGVDGSGLKVQINPSFYYKANLKPNWQSTDVFYARVYLDFSNLVMSNGNTFSLLEQHYDNQNNQTRLIARLLVRRRNGNPEIQYFDNLNNQATDWVTVPSDRPFLLETVWNQPDNKISLSVDGGIVHKRSTNLQNSLLINRADIVMGNLDAGTSGSICLDELVYDDLGASPLPKAAVKITPNHTLQTSPGGQIVFNHTVKNEGDVTDIFDLTATINLSDWSVQVNPGTVGSLPPGESATVNVTVTAPADALATDLARVNVVAQSQTDSSATDRARNKVSVQAVPGVSLLAEKPTGTALPGEKIRLKYIITNEGNAEDTFSINTTINQADWAVRPIPYTVGPLAPGDSTNFKVRVTVPADELAYSQANINVDAQSQLDPTVTDQINGQVDVEVAPDVAITPNLAATILPGEQLVLDHKVENKGNIQDTFDVTATVDLADWSVQVNSGAVEALAPGEYITISVTVTAPADALATDLATVKVVAKSQADGLAKDTARNKVSVQAVPDVSLLVEKSTGTALPGEKVDLNYIITNKGNIADTFHISTTVDQVDWSVHPIPSTVGSLAAGDSTNLRVRVTVPADELAYSQANINVAAQSQLDSTVTDQANGQVDVEAAPDVAITPNLSATILPGEQLVLDHKIENKGNVQDIFDINATVDLAGWSVQVNSGTVGPLTPGGYITVSVVVTAPADALPVDLGTVNIVAQSQTDGTVKDTAQDEVSVQTVLGVSLYAETSTGAALPGEKVDLKYIITNEGNIEDAFHISTTVDQTDWSVHSNPHIVGPLVAGESANLKVSVTVPADALAYVQADISVAAQSQLTSTVTDQANSQVEVEAVRDMILSDNLTTTTLSGQRVVFTHIITNQGNITDNYELKKMSDLLGWEVNIIPEVVQYLEPGHTDIFTVSVLAPDTALGYSEEAIVVMAQSQTDNAIKDTVEDRTIVEVVRKIDMGPGQKYFVSPGDQVKIIQTVTNQGNISETILMTGNLPDWTTTVSPTTFTKLNSGTSAQLITLVQVPESAFNGDIRVLTLTATSQADSNVQSNVQYQIKVENSRVYLPIISKN